MVSTRGKRINYAEEDSDDVSGFQIAKPPTKRRKLKNKEPEDDQSYTHENHASIKGRAKGPKGARTAAGKLESFMKLPVDIFAEICQYLRPLDLLFLCRASKRLRAILLDKESRPLWRKTRALVANLPECPEDLSEPAYASLMFETGCMGCSNTTARKTIYCLRARYCKTCTYDHLLSDNDVRRLWPTIPDDLLRNLPRHHVENSRQHPHNCSLYPGRLVHELIQRRESLESKSGLQVELIEELSNTSEIMNNTGNDMQYWKECEARAKQDEVYDLSQKRQSSIEERLKELGWEKGDFPVYKREWRALTFRPTELTDTIWRRIYPKLLPLLQEMKTVRLQQEKDARAIRRKRDVRQFFYAYVAGLKGADPDMPRHEVFMCDGDIMQVPSVMEVLELDTPDVPEETWDLLLDDVKDAIRDHATQIKARLLGLLDRREDFVKRESPESEAGPSSLPVSTSSSASQQLQDTLYLASTVFHCETCDEPVWFIDMAMHTCCRKVSYRLDGIFQSTFQLESIKATWEVKPAIERLIRDLGLEEDCSIPEAEALGMHCLCTRCDERVAPLNNFRQLVSHLIRKHNWYKGARGYIDRLGPAAFSLRMAHMPEVIDTHSADLDEPFGRLIVAEEDMEARRVLREEFQKYCITLEETFQEEDSEAWSFSGSEFDIMERDSRRVCLLCPQTGSFPSYFSPGEMEIHIRSTHRKEPDLRVDSIRYHSFSPTFLDWL